MKVFLLAAALSLSVAAHGYVPEYLKFKCSFQTITASGPQCEGLSTNEEFLSAHTLTGVSGLTSVLNFKGNPGSYFHDLTLVGGFGYNNDFFNEKNFKKGNLTHRVVAKGLVDYSFLLAHVTVTIVDRPAAKVVCTADAEIYGAN